MTARSGPRLSGDAWESLFRAQVTLMRRFAADDVWGELTVREYDVLFTLAGREKSAMRLGELNEFVLLSQPSLSRMVERLERAGYVERTPSAGDRRGTLVALTPSGAEKQREIGRRHLASIHHYMSNALDAGELATLRELTGKLRRAQESIEERHHA
ncbi:MarR family winged helix-turn-helix transcriptional regulator [Spelaeicoccus albus]|uniref:DNA-binding MarR family transcriptional regulator n=1 Tax=Spelaeicoccus albus TaxID=1280376 RepID=A0A7Z0CYX3_9MICO|nr:MarR family transcriptional regulator [Spelaeicoccus albus]NYI65771.1 DNA-binding MarR family transcriptional regulator [Spelaeicoccus albus]